MAYVDAKTWANEEFHPNSRPDLRTVRDWVKNGYVPGRIIGPRRVYINVDAWKKEQTGNDLADKVLNNQ
ncbi:DNA-binding protein [Alkalilimnicola ehrlichii]|uniref:Excisionase-like domain-containing protein n=1 Tax=Alkalilimnicola ehrlichii TaxID=351052 RepID=A0A3E0WT83_9GAMM|nr:DNA-binding protein [Alkalilimnicola ehrlichii]RFA35177.1 hypothetical protein CAL65_13820 [Alkalilimnicola ehrlichii]